MKWKRTAMSLALAGCMMATTVPVTAFAANTTMAVEQQAGTGTKISALTLDQTTCTIAKDNTAVVNAAYSLVDPTNDINPANITWEIKDTDIAVIQGSTSGKAITIKGVKAGETTLTAKFGGDDNTKVWEASCTIKVTERVNTTELSLDKTAATLYTDGTKDSEKSVSLTATLNGSEQDMSKISWSVSNAGVSLDKTTGATVKATVNANTLVDSTLVTAQYENEDGDTVYEVCVITLAQKAAVLNDVKVYEITDDDLAEIASNAKKTIAVGEKLNTKAVCYAGSDKYNGATVTWESQNPAIATVDNGVITGVKEGTTNITVTATAGSAVAKKTFQVEVNDATVPLNDIAISATKLTVAANEDVNLSVTYDPTNATVKASNVTWTSSNLNVLAKKYDEDTGAEIKGSFTAENVGTATVTVTVVGKDANGQNVIKTRACTVVVTKGGVSQVTGFQVVAQTGLVVDHPVKLTTSDIKLVNEANIDIKDEDITWSVSPADAAKIVEGYLIPLKADTDFTLEATINGLKASVVCSAKENLTNNKDDVTAIKFADMKSSSIAMVVGQKVTNVATVTSAGSKTDYTVVYTSSNPAVATVDNKTDVAKDMAVGQVTALAAGTTTITATVGNHSVSYTVTVVDPKDPAPTGFVDVPANAWYANAVNTAAAKGLMNGTGNNKFEPLKTVQRSQVAAIVWNIEGAPAVTGTTPFTDVAADAWYAQAVTWAYQNKVVSGTSATTFAPNQNITRQDFAVVLYNKAGKPAASADLSKFVDASKINSWAQDAVKWAVSKGIINGNDKNELNPTGTLTRAEAASIIVKYVG